MTINESLLQFCRTCPYPQMGVEFAYSREEGHSPSRRGIYVLDHTARPIPVTTITYIDKLKLKIKGLQWYVSSSLPCKHSDTEVPNEAKKSLRKWCPPLEIDFIFIVIGFVHDRTSNSLQIRNRKVSTCNIWKCSNAWASTWNFSKAENTYLRWIRFLYTVPWPCGLTCT